MKRYVTLILMVAMAALAFGCSGDDEGLNLGSTDPVDPVRVELQDHPKTSRSAW